jgi:hypothetical protein
MSEFDNSISTESGVVEQETTPVVKGVTVDMLHKISELRALLRDDLIEPNLVGFSVVLGCFPVIIQQKFISAGKIIQQKKYKDYYLSSSLLLFHPALHPTPNSSSIIIFI